MLCDTRKLNTIKPAGYISGIRLSCIAALLGFLWSNNMKQIDVSTPTHPNVFAIIDDCDYEEISKHKWYAAEMTPRKLYAQRKIRVDGKQETLTMHVAIMGKVDGKEIDHREGNGLDNQRHNLRHCTHSENMQNQCVRRGNSSGYKGVSWHKREKAWHSRIKQNGKLIYLGSFTCLVKAAKAYDTAAREHFGEFARLNFPA